LGGVSPVRNKTNTEFLGNQVCLCNDEKEAGFLTHVERKKKKIGNRRFGTAKTHRGDPSDY
jgi:hypothetical protein